LCTSPATLAESPAGRIVTFAMTQLAISATQIRRLLASGAVSVICCPTTVIAYIRQHLYPEY
jgi:nicotinate-nucleotide adenylyltransferase